MKYSTWGQTDKWRGEFLLSEYIDCISESYLAKRANSEIDINGFIGHADLFPYKPSLNDPRVLKASLNFGNNISKAGYRRKQPPMHTGFPQPGLHDLSSRTQAPSDYDFTFSVPDSTSQSPSQGQGQDNTQVTDLLAQSQSPISLSFPSLNNTSAQNNLSDFPRLDPSEVREENKLTTSLFGTSYTHAVSMLDMQGEKTIYFVFSVSAYTWHPTHSSMCSLIFHEGPCR